MIPKEILNYVIIRKIGEGGMGQVFLARNKSIHQFVAIKMLHPRYGNSPALRERFRNEAIMLSSLNHPNIVKFLNYVENENGVFLIMEYVDGMTLEDYINTKTGLLIETKAYPMMRQILDAFSYAHGRGIVHRDIKPSNIFVTKDGDMKVLDFGIAQIVNESGDYEVQHGGSAAYMSPEQAMDRKPDVRSDIYSLGVVFYQMLTGRAPYDMSSLSSFEIKRRVVEMPLERMRATYEYISDGIQKVIDKATSKKAEDRYRSCGEFLAAVDKVESPAKKNRWALIAVISGAAVLLLSVGGLLIWNYNTPKTEYYADYVEVGEIPEGIRKLSKEELSTRGEGYRIESFRGKVRKMTYVDGHGEAMDQPEEERYGTNRNTEVKYLYDEDGKLEGKEVCDRYGKMLYKVKYDESYRHADYTIAGHDCEKIKNAGKDTFNVSAGGRSVKVAHFRLEHDKESDRLTKVLFKDCDDEKTHDSKNTYGREYRYDQSGRVERVTYLDIEENATDGSDGVGIIEYRYDKQGNRVGMSFYNQKGYPAADSKGRSRIEYRYDDKGRRKGERSFDKQGNEIAETTEKIVGKDASAETELQSLQAKQRTGGTHKQVQQRNSKKQNIKSSSKDASKPKDPGVNNQQKIKRIQ